MRRRALWLGALLVVAPMPAGAAGCDLDQVIGYQLVFSGTIEGYVDNAGQRHDGFKGCEPGRIVVFTNRTGLRCKGEGRQDLVLPKGYVFGRSHFDLKLCVDDAMYDVLPLK